MDEYENSLPSYPPVPPLTTDDPNWLTKQLNYLERRREFLLDELGYAGQDVKDALAEATLAQVELEGEVGVHGLCVLVDQPDEDWAAMARHPEDVNEGMNGLLAFLATMLGPATVRSMVKRGIAIATRRGEEVDDFSDETTDNEEDGQGDEPNNDDGRNGTAPSEESRDTHEETGDLERRDGGGQSEVSKTFHGGPGGSTHDAPEGVETAAYCPSTSTSTSTSRKRKRSPSVPLEDDDGNIADDEDRPSTPKRSRKLPHHDGAWRAARRSRLSEATSGVSASPTRELSAPPVTSLPLGSPPLLSPDDGESSPESDSEFWSSPIPGPKSPPPRRQLSPSPESPDTHGQLSLLTSSQKGPAVPLSIFSTMSSFSRKRQRTDDETHEAPNFQLPTPSESHETPSHTDEVSLARPIPKRAKVAHAEFLASSSSVVETRSHVSPSPPPKSSPTERPRAPAPDVHQLPMNLFQGFGPSLRDSWHQTRDVLEQEAADLPSLTEDVPDPDYRRENLEPEIKKHFRVGIKRGTHRLGPDIVAILALVPSGRREPPPTFQLYPSPVMGAETPMYIPSDDGDIDVEQLLLDAISLPPDNNAPEPIFADD
ncbi:hypothetical protein HGRIS_010830 [Hohenbuehelia grisea]|uniref:Uncharacterized protein n=1 Tax=Hohenbuehelia grisea TaxID=104357 RepID=A0ABR3IXX9_9AGAR